jgi:Flp pilus assembly protein TadG
MSDQRRNSWRAAQRRGAAVVWILVATPVILVLFMVVLSLASIWQARAELQNAVEAAALAGAKLWGDNADTPANRTSARLAAQAVFQSNTVFGNMVSIASNDNPSATNNNQTTTGPILLGSFSSSTFYVNQSPATVNERACYVITTASITPLLQGLGVLGPFTVKASAAAVYTGTTQGSGTPQLTIVTSISTQ